MHDGSCEVAARRDQLLVGLAGQPTAPVDQLNSFCKAVGAVGAVGCRQLKPLVARRDPEGADQLNSFFNFEVAVDFFHTV